MSNHIPYLQRRGVFSFRIAVPSDLSGIIGKREFIKSLHTTDKCIAVPLALRLAASAKQLFNQLKISMSKSNNAGKLPLKNKDKLIHDEEDELEEGEGISIGYIFEIDLDEFRSPKRIKFKPNRMSKRRLTPLSRRL